MKYIFVVVIVFLSTWVDAQCTNWNSQDFDSFEYTTNCPYLIPGSVYHLAPKGSGFGPNYTGSYHLYLNFQNGFTGPALDRPYNVCIGNTYRISFYHRDAWGGTNDNTFNVYDGNGVLLSSTVVVSTGAAWNQYVSPALTATTTILRLEVINNASNIGNNDMVIDDMMLEVCGVTENTSYTFCGQNSSVDLFSAFSANVPTGGAWSGPSALSNGDLGTFDPAINTAGLYTYDANPGCPPSSFVNVSLSPNVDLGPDTTLCAGSPLILDAGAGFDSYSWSTGSTAQTISAGNAGTYIFEGGTLMGNEVINGDFEGGTTAAANSFTTSYNVGSGGAWGLLSNAGEYAITTSPNLVHNNFPVCGDHTTGFGNMLVCNGASVANTMVWSQTVNVTAGTDYLFSYWAMRVSNDPATSDLQLYINGIPIGPINSTGAVCGWLGVNDIWNSGGATSAILSIVNQSTSGSGNDFALDDITFAPLCISADTIIVSVETPAQLTSFTDPSCEGLLDGEILVDNTLGVEYSDDGGVTWQADSFFVNLGQGNYNICSRSTLGCVVCENVILTDPVPVTLTVSNDTIICENGTAFLAAYGAGGTSFTYHWDFTANTGAYQTVNSAIATNYTVFVENENGCVSAPETITVDLFPPLTGAILGAATICPTDSAYIEASVIGGVGAPYTFVWSTGADAVTGGVHGITVAPNDTTTYTVTISDGCESTPITLTVDVNVAALPVPQYMVTNPVQCEPAIFEIVNTTDPSQSQYVFWLVDGQYAYANQDTIYTPELWAGQYDIQMIITNFQGCLDSTTFIEALEVQPVPTAAFGYSPNPTTMFNTQITFVNSSINANQYDWTFVDGDPSSSIVTNPTVLFPDGQTGEYEVMLIATSELGCSDTAYQTVIIYPEVILYAPNAFTPDGDEFNQDWRVHMEGIDIYNFHLRLFNRWGELIWETRDPESAWDGTYNGRMVETGTYTWTIWTKNILNDEKLLFNGHVTVLR
ncbi:MAG: gliding motility-associated C-terminal domain-containing protein [Crocinitomicaceae bacterium]|nr:gliding motility-associated C-terminal domain-containing protein [Crocinitomicaceae bacterium]